jgi:DNA polymerase III alpha subunit (gram-positive type)
MSRVCFLDTETTGLHPTLHQVWEVGLICREVDDEGRSVSSDDEFHWFLPVDLTYADPFALKLGGFYERWKDPTMMSTFVEQFVEFTADATMIGCVVSFDVSRLETIIRGEGLLPRWDYHILDVEPLMLGFLAHRGTPVTPPWKSVDLSSSIGVDPERYEKHTAFGDARWARDIYDVVMAPREV